MPLPCPDLPEMLLQVIASLEVSLFNPSHSFTFRVLSILCFLPCPDLPEILLQVIASLEVSIFDPSHSLLHFSSALNLLLASLLHPRIR